MLEHGGVVVLDTMNIDDISYIIYQRRGMSL